MDTESANNWFNKGVTLGNLGRHVEALECFDKAIEIKPTHEQAWLNKELS